jgi:hypothetical protein
MRFFSMGAWAAKSGVARADRQSTGDSGGDVLVWDEAGYRDHLAVVGPSLPRALVAAADERRQRVESLLWEPELARLDLLISTATRPIRTWRYSGVSRYEWLDHRLRIGPDDQFGIIGCHELHLPAGTTATFEHRMLLSSGMELVIAAEEFEQLP